MIEGETLGTIGMAVGVFGLLIAFMLYRKVDSIEIENKTVAKITERIQDGAMAFMVAAAPPAAPPVAAPARPARSDPQNRRLRLPRGILLSSLRILIF